MHLVPLDRPPRRPAGALTDAVRETILKRAWQLFDLEEADVLSSHVDADYLADTRRLVGHVELRYPKT